jgi:hypothetical protein
MSDRRVDAVSKSRESRPGQDADSRKQFVAPRIEDLGALTQVTLVSGTI